MTSSLAHGLWLETLPVLTLGIGLIVALAALIERWIASAVWQRTVWQIALVGTFLLALAELTGTAPALIHLARTSLEVADGVSSQGTRAEPAAAQGDGGEAGRFPLPPLAEEGGMGEPGSERRNDPPAWAGPAVAGAAGDPWRPARLARPSLPAPQALDAKPPFPDFPRPLVEEGRGRRAKGPATAAQGAENRSSQPQIQPLAAALLGLWLSGVVLLVLRFAWARALLGLFRRRQVALSDPALKERVAAIAGRLGIRRPVRVLESRRLTTPVVAGSFPAVVILPAGFAAQFAPREQEAMLAHELAHVAAGDPAWQLVADLAGALVWWHPLVWWARRRLRMASEAAADEASLLLPDGPEVLAACLVAAGQRMAAAPRLGWLGMSEGPFRSNLGRRVERLLRLTVNARRVPARRSLFLAKTTLPVVLVLVVVFTSAWARPQAVFPKGATTMRVLASSWRHSLAAAVFVAFWAPAAINAPADEPRPAIEREEAEREEAEREEAEREEAEREEAEREEAEREEAEREEAEREEAEREEGRRPESPEARREGERRELQERAERILRELRDLKPEQRELADRLERQLHEIRARLRELGAEWRPEADRQRLMRHLEELKVALDRARERGDREQIHRLEREAQEVMGRLRERMHEGREDVDRRLEHLRKAVENLHAGGFHDLAERLQHEAESMMRGFRDREGPEGLRPPRPERPDGPPPHANHPAPPRPDHPRGPAPELERMIHELRGEIQRLHHEVEGLRDQVHRLTEERPVRPSKR